MTKNQDLRQQTSLWLAALGVLGLFLGIFVSRSIARPIVSLTQTTQEIAMHGNLDQTVEAISGGGEVATLASAFNQMTVALRDTTVSRELVDNILGSMLDALIVVAPGGSIQAPRSRESG